MNSARERLANNIRTLRNHYHESQEQLGLIIDESKQAISMYENAHRTPNALTLHKIALHYNVSDDELLCSDLINRNALFENLNKNSTDIQYRISSAKVTFPIISSDQSLKNESFKKGYLLHNKIIEESAKGLFNDSSLRTFDLCIDCYSKAADEGINDALANVLGFLICCEFGVHNQNLYNGILRLNKKDIDVDIFVREHLLYDEYITQDNESIMSNDDKEELNKSVLELMKELRKKPDYYSLISYYSALRYLTNAFETDYSFGMNNTIGFEMMITELQLGNPYAIDFLLFFL